MGVTDRRCKTKATIVAFVATAVRFLAKTSPFLPFAIVWSPVKVPESPDRAVFVPTTITTDGQTDYFTPYACVRGN